MTQALSVIRSSCRSNEAACGGAAVVKSGYAVSQVNRMFRFYDRFAIERSLRQLLRVLYMPEISRERIEVSRRCLMFTF